MDVNKDLLIGCLTGCLPYIKDLVENQGADVNCVADRYISSSTHTGIDAGASPLILSCNMACTTYLLDHGADVNYANPKNSNRSALHKFVHYYCLEETELLLKSGANVDACFMGYDESLNEISTRTAFFEICAKVGRNYMPLLQLLLNYGANINFQNDQGETPLMNLLKNGAGSMDNVSFLIDNQADVVLTDQYGNTASSIAKSKNLKVYHYIEAHEQKLRLKEMIDDNIGNPVELPGIM